MKILSKKNRNLSKSKKFDYQSNKWLKNIFYLIPAVELGENWY